jgi:GST-like protein
MICYPWSVNTKAYGQDLEEFKYVKRWMEELAERPGVQRGMAVGSDLSIDVSKMSKEEQDRLRKLLYNQRARPAPG